MNSHPVQLDLDFIPGNNYNDCPLYVRGITTRPDGSQFTWDSWDQSASIGLKSPQVGWAIETLIIYHVPAGTVEDAAGLRTISVEERAFFASHFKFMFRPGYKAKPRIPAAA